MEYSKILREAIIIKNLIVKCLKHFSLGVMSLHYIKYSLSWIADEKSRYSNVLMQIRKLTFGSIRVENTVEGFDHSVCKASQLCVDHV